MEKVIGFATGKYGAYDTAFLKGFYNDRIGIDMGKRMLASMFKSSIRNFITKTSILFGDLTARILLVSSVAAAARAMIDYLFGD